MRDGSNRKRNPVYERLRRSAALAVLALGAMAGALPACAQNGDATILEAREALRKKDGNRLSVARSAALAARHPLAMWADYWEFGSRLASASTAEVDAFYARWPGSYVEDRLRNDWLLVVGRRRDWTTFARDFVRYRMNDDREVTCYALLTQHRVRPTVMVPIWRLAAQALGAGTALMGEKAAHACTEAVESVIEEHYADQIAELADREPELAAELTQFRDEELAHHDHAVEHGSREAPAYRLLSTVIKAGCRVAIKVSERV